MKTGTSDGSQEKTQLATLYSSVSCACVLYTDTKFPRFRWHVRLQLNPVLGVLSLWAFLTRTTVNQNGIKSSGINGLSADPGNKVLGAVELGDYGAQRGGMDCKESEGGITVDQGRGRASQL